jgi:GAF domain-containing protein
MDLDFSYLQDVLDAAVASVKADRGVVQILLEPQHKFYVAAQIGFSGEFLALVPPSDPADDASAGGRAASTRQRVIVEDIETDQAYAKHRPAARQAGYRTVIATPLFGRNGKILGMFIIHFKERTQPSGFALRALDGYARMAATVIEAGRLKAEIVSRPDHLVSRKISDVEFKGAIRRLRAHPHDSPLVEQIWQLGDQYVSQLLTECERIE